MNTRWRNQKLSELRRSFGEPHVVLNIPGGGNPPGFVVVYRKGASACIDAFAVMHGADPEIRTYYCR